MRAPQPDNEPPGAGQAATGSKATASASAEDNVSLVQTARTVRKKPAGKSTSTEEEQRRREAQAKLVADQETELQRKASEMAEATRRQLQHAPVEGLPLSNLQPWTSSSDGRLEGAHWIRISWVAPPRAQQQSTRALSHSPPGCSQQAMFPPYTKPEQTSDPKIHTSSDSSARGPAAKGETANNKRFKE